MREIPRDVLEGVPAEFGGRREMGLITSSIETLVGRGSCAVVSRPMSKRMAREVDVQPSGDVELLPRRLAQRAFQNGRIAEAVT